jgi:hypothetical protein
MFAKPMAALLTKGAVPAHVQAATTQVTYDCKLHSRAREFYRNYRKIAE